MVAFNAVIALETTKGKLEQRREMMPRFEEKARLLPEIELDEKYEATWPASTFAAHNIVEMKRLNDGRIEVYMTSKNVYLLEPGTGMPEGWTENLTKEEDDE